MDLHMYIYIYGFTYVLYIYDMFLYVLIHSHLTSKESQNSWIFLLLFAADRCKKLAIFSTKELRTHPPPKII